MATDNNDFTHEFQIYSSDLNAGTMGTGKFLLFDDNINALKVEDVSNIKIGGGEEGQVLVTDGEGNLTWATSSGGGGVAVNADWNSSSGASRILNKPDLTAYLPKTGGTLTGKLNAAQGSGTTGGYSFGGTEGSNDTGMFSNADGILDFYANDVKIVTVTTSGVTSTQAITLPSNPTSNLQAATKQYVDSSVSALNNFSGNYNDLTNKPTVATSAYIGTTQVAFNRSSGALTLEGVSIDGNAATVSNGVYTNGSYANPAWITSLAYSKLTDAPDLATVATSGSYADLTNKPSLATVATTGSYSDLTNRPSIFSGSYTDLTNKPTLFDGAYLSLTGLPNLAAVATSGSYDDLSNKPSIPNLTGYATEAWVQSQGFGSGSGGTSYNQNLNTTDDVTFNTVTITNASGIENAEGQRITNSYYDGVMYVGSNVTQMPVSILMGGAGPRNEWAFTPDGKLTLPEIGTGIGWTNTDTAPTPDTEFLYSSTISFDKNQGIVLNNAVGEGGFSWILGKDGTLTVPGSITQNERLTLNSVGVESGYVAAVLADGNLGRVFLRTDDGTTTRTWEFDKDGNITLPAGGDIKDFAGNSVLSGGSGATSLSALSDVSIEGPIEGSVLTWNDNQSRWENRSIPSSSEITNTDGNSTWSVSVSETGIVTMTTARGSLEFGAQPEEGAPQHFHIMRPAGQEGSTDLYFGDDYNYVKLPGSYGAGSQGVVLGANNMDGGTQQVWSFDTSGNLTLPAGGDIKDSTGTSVLGGGGNANTGNVVFEDNTLYVGGTGYLNLQNDNNQAVIGTNGPYPLLVAINEGDKEWTFDTSGNLTLPAGGDIKDSSGNSVLGGGGGSSLEIVAGDGITVETSGNTITISAESNATPQYGYFTELVQTNSSNQVNTHAVVIDSDSNSYVSYVYWDDNQNKDVGGIAKYDSTGEQLWAVNLASQNPDAGYLNIRSLEFATVDGDPSLIAVGYYYDNNTGKDVAFMFYVNPASGSVGAPIVDCELVSPSGMSVKDGIAGYDGSNPYAVVVGETYDQTLVKTLTPLAGSTTDKLFVSWADFAASGVNTGESVYYVDGPNQYGVTMNAVGVSATVAGSTDPAWAGISITVSKNEAGNYTITGVNGWGYLVNSWSNPVTLTVLGSALGGADGTNDLTFDFSNVIFNNNSSNIQAAVSNIMGTPPAGVYCPGWGGFDWGTQVGNALSFNYQLNNQAYIARFGQTAAWTKNFGGGSYDRLNSVVVDDSQNIYAVGYVWNGSRGGLVIKYDIDGNQQWAVYINPVNNTGNSLMSVDLLSDGNVITVDEDGVITKLDSVNGDIMWQVKADTDPSWDGDFRGTATPDGDYIITNYEDNDYTQYVMRVSGSDGSSVWNKRISRTYGGDNGEVTSSDDGQYIDCNATHLAIAGRTQPPSGNTVGLVYSFPINGENTDGTYGQYVITSESMNWETLSTTSIEATVTNTAISVTVNSTSPTSGSSLVNASTTAMGGEPVVEPTVISWTNPNDNVWRIEEYNGGASVSYNGDAYDARWFDIDNHTSGGSDFRGAIIQYHAFIQNQGTMIGTIHLATDYSQEGATHTEHLSGNSDLQFVTLWDCNNNDGQLYFKMTNGNSANLFIQWTAKVFYGQEYND